MDTASIKKLVESMTNQMQLGQLTSFCPMVALLCKVHLSYTHFGISFIEKLWLLHQKQGSHQDFEKDGHKLYKC